ncbi:MAG: AI-2E family transporter [Dysgonamonadaceae bacterium]|jgi:predicted PurR-regulated permease PerM|nr:AI-2E family transporter [Dysgonamonadaceae bacterium]
MLNNAHPSGSSNKDKEYKYILIGLILMLAIILFQELRPYVSGFLGAATLYVILKGQMPFFTQKLHLGRGLAAAIIIIEALLFFLIPLTGLTFLVADTLSGIHIDPDAIKNQATDLIDTLEERLGFQILTAENLSFIPKVGTSIVQALGASLYSFIINILVILFLLYYMLFSSKSFENIIREILPFQEENKKILAEETKLIIQANAIGIPLLAAVQGIFAYFGYLFFGVNNPMLYALLTAFCTILPIVGTLIVWLPLSISITVSGDITNGVLLFVYGFLIIGGVDNVARFMLQKILADIHPLITIFGVLVGVPMFGFWGVIFGPLILSLFILFLNMYRNKYVPGSKASPRVTTKMKPAKIPTYKSPTVSFKKKQK